MNPHQVLGIHASATAKEIRRAYLRLAKELHPDRNPDPAAAERFLQIRRAYEALSAHPVVPPAAIRSPADSSQELRRRMQQAFESSLSAFERAGIRITIKYKPA
jgi:preprotein translocase subunit Sec63